MAALKLKLGNQIRRARTKETLTFKILEDTAKRLFYNLLENNYIDFVWTDDENESVIISSCPEFEEAMRIMVSEERSIMCFEIKLSCERKAFLLRIPSVSAQSDHDSAERRLQIVVHYGITCSCCANGKKIASPIVGARYRCYVRNLDFCGVCEKKEVQPFPMIKIYTSDTAPFNQSKGRGRGYRLGPYYRGHNGHYPYNQNPLKYRYPTSPHERLPFFKGLCADPSQFPESEHQVASPNENDGDIKSAQQYYSPMLPLSNVFSAIVATKSPDKTTEVNISNIDNSDANITETRSLLIRPFLESNKSDTTAVTTSTTLSSTSSVTMQSALLLSVSMVRFIRHITYPDGTSVEPGASFLKTWSVRNDGAHRWPEDAVLTNVGGDLFARNAVLLVNPLMPGEETEITLEIRAPSTAGHHIAYFRLGTEDGVFFGQKLVADIRVVEMDRDGCERQMEEDESYPDKDEDVSGEDVDVKKTEECLIEMMFRERAEEVAAVEGNNEQALGEEGEVKEEEEGEKKEEVQDERKDEEGEVEEDDDDEEEEEEEEEEQGWQIVALQGHRSSSPSLEDRIYLV